MMENGFVSLILPFCAALPGCAYLLLNPHLCRSDTDGLDFAHVASRTVTFILEELDTNRVELLVNQPIHTTTHIA